MGSDGRPRITPSRITACYQYVLVLGAAQRMLRRGFPVLKSIGREFRVDGNRSLEHVNGFKSLITVGGDVVVYRNARLIDVDFPKSVDSIGGDLMVRVNASLTNCS